MKNIGTAIQSKRAVAAFAAVVLAACGVEPPVQAAAEATPARTEGNRWIAPDDVFSVIIPDGWAAVPDPSADANRLLTIGSPTMVQGQRVLRQCSIEQRRMSASRSGDQAALNRGSADATAESLLGAADPASVRAFSNEIVEGVRVVSFDRDLGGSRHMQKVFPIARADGFIQFTLACGANDGENAATDIAAMNAFMNSLSLNEAAP